MSYNDLVKAVGEGDIHHIYSQKFGATLAIMAYLFMHLGTWSEVYGNRDIVELNLVPIIAWQILCTLVMSLVLVLYFKAPKKGGEWHLIFL